MAGSSSSSLVPGESRALELPQMVHEGRFTYLLDFIKYCERMQWNVEHVHLFFLGVLKTFVSIDWEKRLMIRGKHSAEKITELFQQYLGEYVTCSCGCVHTVLERDEVYVRTCKKCDSRAVVPAPIVHCVIRKSPADGKRRGGRSRIAGQLVN